MVIERVVEKRRAEPLARVVHEQAEVDVGDRGSELLPDVVGGEVADEGADFTAVFRSQPRRGRLEHFLAARDEHEVQTVPRVHVCDRAAETFRRATYQRPGAVARDEVVHRAHRARYQGLTLSPANAIERESAGISSSGTATSADGRADAFGHRRQRVEIEAVHLGRVEPDHARDLVGVDAGEAVAQRLGGVRVGRLDVRVVLAPHDAVDADLVAQRRLARTEEARARVAVGVPVVARQLGHDLHHLAAEVRLRGVRVAEAPELVVEHVERAGHPAARLLGEDQLDARDSGRTRRR